jgi:hypothetical protein
MSTKTQEYMDIQERIRREAQAAQPQTTAPVVPSPQPAPQASGYNPDKAVDFFGRFLDEGGKLDTKYNERNQKTREMNAKLATAGHALTALGDGVGFGLGARTVKRDYSNVPKYIEDYMKYEEDYDKRSDDTAKENYANRLRAALGMTSTIAGAEKDKQRASEFDKQLKQQGEYQKAMIGQGQQRLNMQKAEQAEKALAKQAAQRTADDNKLIDKVYYMAVMDKDLIDAYPYLFKKSVIGEKIRQADGSYKQEYNYELAHKDKEVYVKAYKAMLKERGYLSKTRSEDPYFPQANEETAPAQPAPSAQPAPQSGQIRTFNFNNEDNQFMDPRIQRLKSNPYDADAITDIRDLYLSKGATIEEIKAIIMDILK